MDYVEDVLECICKIAQNKYWLIVAINHENTTFKFWTNTSLFPDYGKSIT